ncbi:tetratricopeptide repeat protein [Roseateles sp. DAIF2]|uniref:nSTAND1 domain-containing NTPase n=1 Tax=Roseateles sp. DAIF2 TaxID=2714952 RepID=UPI0018A2B349|nr:winged helix-turn-helix domain-containing protein [Roseateles sp. DAIF2]QPF72111.1 tetratricopeptide repeat protein [Roseateles sp. DAIF2]
MRFLLGDWAVDPGSNSLSRAGERRQVEPRAMQVLQALSERPGEVFSAEQLLQRCWPEEQGPALGDNPVHKTVAQLRRALEDSATEPRYIETIRKRGYRVVAPVRSDAPGAAPRSREGGWRGGSPFRGLRAFDAAHAEVFFGRELALQQLLAAVQGQWRQRRAFTLLLGPSGSGKTSLVLAGLFPALRGLGATQLDLGDIGAHLPLAALAAALLDWEIGPAGRGLFPGASADTLAQDLALQPDTVLAEIAAARAGHEAPLLLFVDRLEALFVAPHVDAFARRLFLDTLQALADGGDVLVVAACRNDFYPRLSEHGLLMRDKAQGGHFDLVPPTRAEIAQMIRLPARAAGLSFGLDPETRTRLDDQLCDDAAASPDALPLLQYTLEELYRRRGPHGELRFEAYRELGGLDGAIGRRAESEIAALLPIQQQALPHVLALLVMLPGEGQGTTGRRALWDELDAPAERELVQALVDARLLVSDLGEGEQAGFRVAHEAILRRWPRVTEWIAAHQQALQLRSRLRQQVARWLAEGRAAEYLLPKGKQLVEAGELLGRSEFGFSADEQAFVAASQRRAARGNRLRVAALAGLSLLLLLSVGQTWRAERAEQLATRRSAEADDLLGYMLGDFADKLRPIGRLELLDSVGGKALSHLAEGAVDASPQARLQRAQALTVIGEVRVSKRELDAAIEPLEHARALLAEGRPDVALLPRWRKAQGTADFWLGHAHYTKRQFGPARQAWLAYREHAAQWLESAPGEPDAMAELSFAENSLGTLMLDSGDLPAAVRQFRASIELKQRAMALKPEDMALKAWWANSLTWLGTALLQQGEFAAARALFAEGLPAIEQARAKAPNDLEWLDSEAMARSWLGLAWQRLGQQESARAEFRAALALFQQLLRQEPDNRKWRHGRLRVEALELGLRPPGSGAGGRLQELLGELQRLNSGASLTAAARRLPTQVQLSLALGRDLWAQGRAAEAETLWTPLLATLSAALQAQPDDFRLHAERAKVRLALAGPQPRGPLARRHCETVLTELEKLRPLFMVHYEITESWVQAYSCLDRESQIEAERRWMAERLVFKP